MHRTAAIVSSVSLLCASCSVMVTAWYLHLRYADSWPMWRAVVMSWLIAAGEYCLQVPANRIAYTDGELSAAQLRAVAEVSTLTAFVLFSIFILKEPLRLNHVIGFTLVGLGVYIVLMGPFPQVLVDAGGKPRYQRALTTEDEAADVEMTEVDEDRSIYDVDWLLT
mmetsp:Transcript_32750/g.104383  ORF Transcript_32750/g.104383 Transcript_32750/m.104383 type:complete len:166 (+) Transcript_32750:83-580(+)